MGDRMPRKEDGRFIRGKGNYVDDVQLPGMLHSAILRSPLAHAKINNIDVSAALELPGVYAVITGALLLALGIRARTWAVPNGNRRARVRRQNDAAAIAGFNARA